MARALRWLARAAGGLLLAAALLLLLLLTKTGWFLNTKTARIALARFGRDYAPRWSELELRVEDLSLRTKRVVFHAADLCLRQRRGGLAGCFPQLELDATIRLGLSPLVSIRRVERLVLRSRGLRIDQTAAKTAAPATGRPRPGRPVALVPRPLARMTLGQIAVDVASATVVGSSGTTVASVSAAFASALPQPFTAEAFVVQRGTGTARPKAYHALAELDSDWFREGRLTRLDVKAELEGEGLDAAARAQLIPEGGRAALKASAEARMAARSLSLQLDGAREGGAYSGRGLLRFSDRAGPLRRLALEDCRFEGPLDPQGRLKEARLRCGIAATPKLFGSPEKAERKALTGALACWTGFYGKARTRFESRLSVRVGPAPRWHRFFARLKAHVAGDRARLPQSLSAEHALEARFVIERFKDLVAFLDGTDFAVPAPLNALEGPVSFEARTAGPTTAAEQKVEYRLASDLASGRQRLKAQAEGTLAVRALGDAPPSVADTTAVRLQEVAIELPELEIGKTPSPSVDTRIKTGQRGRDVSVERKRQQARAPAASQAPSVTYAVRVLTTQPVRLYSNLAQDPMPIGLDLRATPAGLSGRIQIQSFRMRVFRQQGVLDHLTLAPAPGSSVLALDGKVVYKKQGVTVNILLLGSTSKPKVVFESDPAMSQQEIIGLLLFGKSPGEMDADQQKSAGNAAAAMTSGALGLASLFLFASTPVESVGYDPNTSTYQVRFRLPAGTTLSIGSNLQESRTLGLRKRVTHNIELETELRREAGQRDALTTFLQWFKRS